jgi:uncharacterized surface protein with fasciclin (FAS1) repeats
MMALPSLETFMQADSNLTPFYNEALANNTDFQGYLSSEDYHTILVPSADNFTNFWSNNSFTSAEAEQFFNYYVQDSLNITSRVSQGYINTKASVNFDNDEKTLPVYLNTQVGLLLNNTSSITVQDIVTTNGVIHSLDEVITLPTLADFMYADLELTTFVEAISRDDMTTENYLERLNNTNSTNSPFTIFAPTNQAFEDVLLELFPEQNASLEDIETLDLVSILNLHIAENLNLELDDYTSSTVNTLGGTIEIDTTIPSVTDVNDREALILQRNAIQTLNGVFYKIDTVLLPQL